MTAAGGDFFIRVTVTPRHADGWVELCVDDDGPGIAAADPPHVYERLYGGHEVRPGGSGIGLAVGAALVHAHGGDVSADNRSEGGASFLVRLPALNNDEKRTPATSSPSVAQPTSPSLARIQLEDDGAYFLIEPSSAD